jgi:hypothetical protein
LVSWWTGDEDATDLQGDNDGTLKGTVSYAPGYVSSDFSFTGRPGAYVQVGNAASLKMTTAMTIECWIYPTGPGLADESIIANKEGEYEIARVGATGAIEWAFANTVPGWTWIKTKFVAPEGIRTHVAVTYDNGLITTYGNGIEVQGYGGSGLIGDVDPTKNDFRIGNRQAFPAPWVGGIDELKVYNRALSASEIAAIYAAGASGNCKPALFVQDISPYAIPKTGGNYKVGATVLIDDALGRPTSLADVWVKVRVPQGGSFSNKVTTNADGIADYSIYSSVLGEYVFTVESVQKTGRDYSPQINVESQDVINVP